MPLGPKMRVVHRGEMAKFSKRLAELSQSDVMVGIPQRRTSREGEAINNASLLLIQSRGSALAHIPSRPLIEPAIEERANNAGIAKRLADAAKLLMKGQASEAERALGLAGQFAVNRIHEWFHDPRNGWAPNKPSTIKRKHSDVPLIDTGALFNSITWVLGKRK